MGWLTKHVRGVPSAGSLESGPLDRWLTRFIPRELVEDHIRSRARAFLLMRFTIVAAIFTVVFAPYFAFYLKLPYTGLMNLLYGISLALTPVILHRTRSLRIAANWTLSSAFAVLLFQSWVLGGVSSLAYPWLACLPMAAMLLRGVRGGARWTLVSVIGVVGVGVADMMGLLPQRTGVGCHRARRNDGHHRGLDAGPWRLGLVGRKPRGGAPAGPSATEAGLPRARRSRLADWSCQSLLAHRVPDPELGARPPARAARRPVLHRPERFQVGQRRARPRGGRPGVARGRVAASGHRAVLRPRRADRRRRVRVGHRRRREPERRRRAGRQGRPCDRAPHRARGRHSPRRRKHRGRVLPGPRSVTSGTASPCRASRRPPSPLTARSIRSPSGGSSRKQTPRCTPPSEKRCGIGSTSTWRTKHSAARTG